MGVKKSSQLHVLLKTLQPYGKQFFYVNALKKVLAGAKSAG